MTNIIPFVIILIILMYSPKLYSKYIQFRRKKVDSIRQNIFKHFREMYIYLPSRNLMTYNLNYPITLEYWVNYVMREQKENELNLN